MKKFSDLSLIRTLIASDSTAIAYQNMAGYRNMLIAHIDALMQTAAIPNKPLDANLGDFTYQGEGGMFVAGISIGEHTNAIEVYNENRLKSEEIRDIVLSSIIIHNNGMKS